MKTLPVFLQDTLKTTPIGVLVPIDQDFLGHLPTDHDRIISVGDQVTGTLLEHGISPWVAIVDYITQRKPVDSSLRQLLTSFGDVVVRVSNPPGCISQELWDILQQTLSHSSTETIRIDVDGEEDLAALAAISLAPSDATVIYGLPNKGVVLVPTIQEHKDLVNKILEQM